MKAVYVTAPPKGMEWPYPLREWVDVSDEVAAQLMEGLRAERPESPNWLSEIPVSDIGYNWSSDE